MNNGNGTKWIITGIIVSIMLFGLTIFESVNTALANSRIENLTNQIEAERNARVVEDNNLLQLYKDVEGDVKDMTGIKAEMEIVLKKLQLTGY